METTNDFKKTRLVLVITEYKDGINQCNCFHNENEANAFINIGKHASNIKTTKKIFVDAIYPLIAYNESLFSRNSK